MENFRTRDICQDLEHGSVGILSEAADELRLTVWACEPRASHCLVGPLPRETEAPWYICVDEQFTKG